MTKRSRTWAAYGPSVMTRYSIQLMIVSLPWLLQKNNVPITSISLTLSLFYAGSLLAALIGGRYLEHMNIRTALITVLISQAVVTSACFFTDEMAIIGLLRFAQGAFTGILRPLNQIWLLEYFSGENVAGQTRRSTFGQVAIAIGSALGNFLGATAAMKENGAVIGAVACLAPVLVIVLLLPKLRTKEGCGPMKQKAEGLAPTLAWLMKNPVCFKTLSLYLLSLVIFKLWVIGVPLYFRSMAAYSPEVTTRILTIALTMSPIGFAVGQFIMGLLTRYYPKSRETAIPLLMASNLVQALLTWASLYVPGQYSAIIFLFLGGGLFGATTYPLVTYLLLSEIDQVGRAFRRPVMLFLSIAADFGQVIGGFLLALPLHVTALHLEVMVVPIALSIALCTPIGKCVVKWVRSVSLDDKRDISEVVAG